MLVERVLEAGGEVDLGRLDGREAMEELVGQRRGAVLDGAGQAVLAGDRRQPLERPEVELDLGDAAARQRHAAVAGAGLDADLADADGRRPGHPVELAPEAIEVGPQLVLGRVLLADLADLAADADGHVGRLERG